jgi:hypothetical protein
MNCKGNELARLVVPEGIQGCEHHGKIVWITDQNTIAGPSAPVWNYSGDRLYFEKGFYAGKEIPFLGDRYLRPIGNPGENEVDETLLWKKVPDYVKPKEETAKS